MRLISSWIPRRSIQRKITGNEMSLVTAVARYLTLLLFGVFFGLPLVWMLIATTKTDAQLRELPALAIGDPGHIITAWNRLLGFNDGILIRWMWNSLFYTFASVTLSVVIALLAGYALAIGRPHGRRVILSLTLVAMLIPSSALVLPLFLELNSFHLIDTPYSVILPAAFFPFGVYLAFIYFAITIPRDLLLVARVDGCNEWQVFWYVARPLSYPLVGLLAFLSFNANWNNYFGPYVFLQSTENYNLPVGLQALIASTSALIPGAPNLLHIYRAEVALAGLIMIIPVAVIFLFAQRFVTTGALTGATKE